MKGLGHLQQITNRNTHIMNEVFSNFLEKLWEKSDGKYDIEIRNIRKGHTPHNAYVVWKSFKLESDSRKHLNDHQSRAGAPYFFEAFDVLKNDLASVRDEFDPLVFTVTIQGRLKVRVKNYNQNCDVNFTDSAMFAIDKQWMLKQGHKAALSTKNDILSGLTCALSDQPTLYDNFNRAGKCLQDNRLEQVYKQCPIYLKNKSSMESRVTDLVAIFINRIKSEIRFEPCPITRDFAREPEEEIYVKPIESPTLQVSFSKN